MLNRRTSFAGLALLFLASSVYASNLGRSDAVPAATLLLPYFEAEIGDADGDGFGECNGINTLFSINNASASPTLAHVTLWTDWSVATIDFEVYLTGYDVQTINLCEVFTWGNLPITADDPRDPDDTISPQGPFSLDTGFPGCATFFPFEEGLLRGFYLDFIQNAHAGYPVPGFGEECMAAPLNGVAQCSGGSCPVGTVVRGYVTVDAVRECSLAFAGTPGYFLDGGIGIATDDNVLWGDYFHVDRANDFAQGEPLVHIEANPGLNAFNVPLTDPATGATVVNVANQTGQTFYGRYNLAFTGADNREPLGTTWAARYLNGFDGTTFTVWRDSTQQVTAHPESYACGLGPPWFPLNETQVVCFDEAEDAVELCGFDSFPVSPPINTDEVCFPYETGRYLVGEEPLDPPFDFGWCFLDLNTTYAGPGGPPFPGVAQSHVSAQHFASGRFSVGLPAVQLRSALQPPPFFRGAPPSASASPRE